MLRVLKNIRATVVIFGIAIGTLPTSAGAIEPNTVIAAATAVNALQSLLGSKSRPGLDPASRAYFEQLLENQALIAKQASIIADQVKILAKMVEGIPRETIELDKVIDANSVYTQAIDLELQILQSKLNGQMFDEQNRAVFTEILNRLHQLSADYQIVVKKVSQSIDIIVSLHLLSISLEAMVNIARNANFTTGGDKDHFGLVIKPIKKAVEDIKFGRSSPKSGRFVSRRLKSTFSVQIAIHKMIISSAKKKCDLYRITADESFYRAADPREWTSPEIDTRREVSRWEYCSEVAGSIAACMRSFCCPPPNILGHYIEPSVLSKHAIGEEDRDSIHFLLEITPYHAAHPFVRAMEEFNSAQIQARLYNESKRVVDRSLEIVTNVAKKVDEM